MISSLVMVSFPWTHKLQLGESDTPYKVATFAFAMWKVEERPGNQGQVRQSSMSITFPEQIFGNLYPFNWQSFIEYLLGLDFKKAAMNKLDMIIPIMIWTVFPFTSKYLLGTYSVYKLYWELWWIENERCKDIYVTKWQIVWLKK